MDSQEDRKVERELTDLEVAIQNSDQDAVEQIIRGKSDAEKNDDFWQSHLRFAVSEYCADSFKKIFELGRDLLINPSSDFCRNADKAKEILVYAIDLYGDEKDERDESDPSIGALCEIVNFLCSELGDEVLKGMTEEQQNLIQAARDHYESFELEDDESVADSAPSTPLNPSATLSPIDVASLTRSPLAHGQGSGAAGSNQL